MKALVIFGSTWGNTRTVAHRLPTLLTFPLDIIDVKTLDDQAAFLQFQQYDLLMFLASVAGDQELQPDMEHFLAGDPVPLRGKPYAVCELGNYFGYDDFDFGAERIMRDVLAEWGGN